MTARRVARGLTCLATSLLLLTGCGDLPFASSPSATAPTPVPTPEPVTSSPTTDPRLERAGRQLDEAQAEAALAGLPRSAKPGPEPSAQYRKTDPKPCIDVLRLGWYATNLKRSRTVAVTRGWTQGKGTGLQAHNVRIESHSRPVGANLLDQAGAALAGCDSFSLTGRDEAGPIDLRLLAEPRTTATLGDQTFAVRITTFGEIGGRQTRIYADYLVVRVGHSLITLTQTSTDEASDMTTLERHAEDIISRLAR